MEHAAWQNRAVVAGPRAPLLHALAALGSTVGLALGLDALVGRLVRGMGRSSQAVVVAAELLLESTLAGFAVWFYARRTGWRAIDLGLRRPRNGVKDAVAAIIVTWVISIFAAGAYSYVAFPAQHDKVTVQSSCADGSTPSQSGTCGQGASARPATKTVEVIPAPAPPQHVLVRALHKDELPLIVRISIFVAACALAPIFEELLFRGFLYRALSGHVGQYGAVLLSSVGFAFVHAGAVPLKATVVQGILGVGLCLLYRQQASLWPGIVVHAFQNSIGTSLASGIGLWTVLVVAGAFAWIGLWAWKFRGNAAFRDPAPGVPGPAIESALATAGG